MLQYSATVNILVLWIRSTVEGSAPPHKLLLGWLVQCSQDVPPLNTRATEHGTKCSHFRSTFHSRMLHSRHLMPSTFSVEVGATVIEVHRMFLWYKYTDNTTEQKSKVSSPGRRERAHWSSSQCYDFLCKVLI